jgi:uncharacterized protein (TIGR03083 family)
MDYQQHVEAVRREIDSLNRALGDGAIDAPVPSCPEWTLADLTLHVGQFAGWWTHILCEGTGRPRPESSEPPAGNGRVDWCATALADLLGELEETPPDTSVWTWSPDDKTARFPARRSAHELAVHRFDAQLARGTQQPIEVELATDGIDEIFVMIAHRGPSPDGAGESIHLHATDCDAEWMLIFGEAGIEVRHAHEKGDAAVRGAVSDLELLLYQRPTIGPVERFGDERPLELFYRAFTF